MTDDARIGQPIDLQSDLPHRLRICAARWEGWGDEPDPHDLLIEAAELLGRLGVVDDDRGEQVVDPGQ